MDSSKSSETRAVNYHCEMVWLLPENLAVTGVAVTFSWSPWKTSKWMFKNQRLGLNYETERDRCWQSVESMLFVLCSRQQVVHSFLNIRDGAWRSAERIFSIHSLWKRYHISDALRSNNDGYQTVHS